MNAREHDLVAACDQVGIPVEGVVPDRNYMITMDRFSELPTEDELKWLVAYRNFKEQQEYSPAEIQAMHARAASNDDYPVMPPQMCGLYTYRFIKYGDDDWAYVSHGWTLGGAFPRSPEVRSGLAGAGHPSSGPFSLREVLDAITGQINLETGRPEPGRRWAAWVSADGNPLMAHRHG